MKRTAIAVPVIVCLLVACGFEYAHHLRQKFEPLQDTPGIALQARQFVPVEPGQTRSLNLGYERVLVPDVLRGELFAVASKNFVCLGKPGDYSLVFCPPTNDRNADRAALIQQINWVAGTSAKNWFEVSKLALAERPFTTWQLSFFSRRKKAPHAMLLMVKALTFGGATSVRIAEIGHLGVIVRESGGFDTIATIEDLGSGLSQEVHILRSAGDANKVVSAIISAYELNVTSVDDHSVGQLIAGTGMTVLNKPPAVSSAEMQRLDAVEAEVQARRRLRQLQNQSVPVEPTK